MLFFNVLTKEEKEKIRIGAYAGKDLSGADLSGADLTAGDLKSKN